MIKNWLMMIFLINGMISWGADTITGKVISVIDGNTFEIANAVDERYRIILYGVDCPELGQPFSEEAKKELEKLILKQKVTVEIKGKDRHGTRLGVVLVKNKDPRKILLKNGLAWTSEHNPMSELEKLRLEASTKKNGIWLDNSPTPPWTYRREQSMRQPKSG